MSRNLQRVPEPSAQVLNENGTKFELCATVVVVVYVVSTMYGGHKSFIVKTRETASLYTWSTVEDWGGRQKWVFVYRHWCEENEMVFVSHKVPFPATSDRRSRVAGNGTEWEVKTIELSSPTSGGEQWAFLNFFILTAVKKTVPKLRKMYLSNWPSFMQKFWHSKFQTNPTSGSKVVSSKCQKIAILFRKGAGKNILVGLPLVMMTSSFLWHHCYCGIFPK